MPLRPSQLNLTQDARLAVHCGTAVLVIFAYLIFVNLDWTLLWDDEGTVAHLARNWVELGRPLVDDGRNVYSYRFGGDIAGDLTFRYPPLMTLLLASVFSVFGVGEIPARALSGAFSLAGMLLFADILRREFPNAPGFAAVALALAALSPLTIGFARSATFNGVALFLHLAVFWCYLRFCARGRIGYALLAGLAALAAYHTHYLSGVIFVAALAVFHLLFRRRCFDRRMWWTAAAVGAVFAAQVLWHYAAEYSTAAYGGRTGGGRFGNLFSLEYVLNGLAALNHNGILPWSVALWFAARYAYLMAAAPRKTQPGRKPKNTPSPPPWRDLWENRAFQYAVLVVTAITLQSLLRGPDVRYATSFAPFAAPLGAAVVCQAWRLAKPAGAAVCAVLLLSNLAAWPFAWHAALGKGVRWTLPALAVEYHRDYPDARHAAMNYLREKVKRDTLVWSNLHNPGWPMFYLSDHLRFCCTLSLDVKQPAALQTSNRDWLFKEHILIGTVKPEWALFFGWSPAAASVLLAKDGPDYRLETRIPGEFVPREQRPEPHLHNPFPGNRRPTEYGAIRFYRLER